MSRIKIDVSGNIIDTVSIAVRITDINYGNHLGNDSMVSILHEARVLWLKKNDFTELNAGGAGLIMADLGVEYINESYYGDMLTIFISCGGMTNAGFELYYLVQTTRQEKVIMIAKAKTGMVCYDYINKKVIAVPEKLKEVLRTIN